MKTDTIFYNLFLEFPAILFELIDSSPEEAAIYEFTSREIKQLSFRLDGLFLPTTEDAENDQLNWDNHCLQVTTQKPRGDWSNVQLKWTQAD